MTIDYEVTSLKVLTSNWLFGVVFGWQITKVTTCNQIYFVTLNEYGKGFEWWFN